MSLKKTDLTYKLASSVSSKFETQVIYVRKIVKMPNKLIFFYWSKDIKSSFNNVNKLFISIYIYIFK